MSRKISIVGAGLVGSLWAVLLRKQGYEVTIFERRKDIRLVQTSEERSINLILTSRGLNGLQAAGLLEEAIALSVPVLGRMIHARGGDLTFQPYGKDDECNFSISRAELNKFLLDAAEKAGAQIHFEHSLENIDFEKKNLQFEHHAEVVNQPYDLLFGTDGAGSRVRKNLCRQFPQEFQEKTEWLEADYKELFLPAGPGQTSRLEKKALHIWPRGSHMMMALANLDGSFTLTLYMPQQSSAVNFAQMKTKADVQNLFAQEFPDAIPLMPRYAEDFMQHPQGKLGTVKCSRWIYQDSVALMGDAAHGIVPFFGQGMNSGFEDCLQLLQILKESNQEKENWNFILSAFEKKQKPNADAIAAMALENWYEMRDKVGDVQFLLRKKVEALLEKKFPQLFKSRYGMVTYTLIPYAEAQAAGHLQDRLLSELCAGLETPEALSLSQAERLLQGDLAEFLRSRGIKLETDALVSATRERFR